jgi:hypothetical protein
MQGSSDPSFAGDRVDIDIDGSVASNGYDGVGWLNLEGICFSTTP